MQMFFKFFFFFQFQFAADHDVKAMISEVAPMKEANKHLQTCREGKARFRIVLKN